ncbi:hypothetical protein [Paenibacillus gansuensis]|uniref:Uncharacterized protein n=1 Tax=Paenibacillus gansuensis TaxID=306542 RepID=A0ABW5P9K1_9BACL
MSDRGAGWLRYKIGCDKGGWLPEYQFSYHGLLPRRIRFSPLVRKSYHRWRKRT